MKKIPLRGKRGEGLYLLVDDEDYDYLSKFNWFANISPVTKSVYARALVPAHRLVMGLPEEKAVFIDHKNRDTLDNQKSNLRLCNNMQNQWNRGKANKSNFTSQFKGVGQNDAGHWTVRIAHKGKRLHLGVYPFEKDAAQAYDYAAERLQGEFAYLNFPYNYRPYGEMHPCLHQIVSARFYSAVRRAGIEL